MSDLPKAYDPSLVEEKWQSRWIEEGCFKADPASEKPAYSVVIPPPNVTGVLHLGHVLNNTIQDILVRRARQKGYEALWLPGTDHAGIATQVRVEKDLKQTTGRSRHDLGREAFLEKVWEWKEKHGGIIINQLHKLGVPATGTANASRWMRNTPKPLDRSSLNSLRKDSSTGAAAWSTGALYPSRPSLMKKSS